MMHSQSSVAFCLSFSTERFSMFKGLMRMDSEIFFSSSSCSLVLLRSNWALLRPNCKHSTAKFNFVGWVKSTPVFPRTAQITLCIIYIRCGEINSLCIREILFMFSEHLNNLFVNLANSCGLYLRYRSSFGWWSWVRSCWILSWPGA